MQCKPRTSTTRTGERESFMNCMPVIGIRCNFNVLACGNRHPTQRETALPQRERQVLGPFGGTKPHENRASRRGRNRSERPRNRQDSRNFNGPRRTARDLTSTNGQRCEAQPTRREAILRRATRTGPRRATHRYPNGCEATPIHARRIDPHTNQRHAARPDEERHSDARRRTHVA